MHSIDYFCLSYEITNTDLAKLLGVKQPQVGSWKSGRRQIPQYHKDEMRSIFSIPEDKEYLLERYNVSENDRAEIELLLWKAKLKNYDINTLDEEYSQLKESVRSNLVQQIKICEGEIQMLEVVNELKGTLRNENMKSTLLYTGKFKAQLDRVRDLIKEIKEEI